jgi:hypothetical protein
MGKQCAGKQHAHQATVKGHAAFPDIENVQRVRQVVRQPVEQHVSQAPADDRTQHAVEHQVLDILAGEAMKRLARLTLRDTPAPQQHELREGHQVHQPVPAYGQGAYVQGDGIELRMDEHGRKSAGRNGQAAILTCFSGG